MRGGVGMIVSRLPAAGGIAYVLGMMVHGGRFTPARWLVLGGMMLLGAAPARAENIGITARKFVAIDKLEFSNKAAVRLLSRDPRIRKGSGQSVATIGATLDVTIEAFNHPPIAGAFSIPQGVSETAGWRVNDASVAKYVNPQAPGGPTQVRVAVVQENALVKVSAKGLGDLPIPLDELRFAPFDVQVRFVVLNGTETITHCTVFHSATCSLPLIGGGTGRKLQCTDGQAVSDCVFPPLP
jgi:hypothetical protein